MKYFVPLFFLAVLFTACNNRPGANTYENKHDTVVIIHRDTVIVMQKAEQPASAIESAKPVKEEPIIKKEKPAPPAIPQKIAKSESKSDTTYYYYINKRVSVKITPWVNEERWVLLFNLQGEETYRQQEIHKSYSETAILKFHPNGAVSQMEIHSNPGASRYWYETTITLGTANDPIQKVSERQPTDMLELSKPWEYWDSKAKQWKKQQVQE